MLANGFPWEILGEYFDVVEKRFSKDKKRYKGLKSRVP